jgi:hypothetical protein
MARILHLVHYNKRNCQQHPSTTLTILTGQLGVTWMTASTAANSITQQHNTPSILTALIMDGYQGPTPPPNAPKLNTITITQASQQRNNV